MPADAHDGDYKGQIKNKRRDKLGQIFTALNDMSATLSENMQTIITQTNEARKEAKEAEEASVATKTALQKAETAKADGMHQAGSQLEGIAEEISSSRSISPNGRIKSMTELTFKKAASSQQQRLWRK